MASMTRNRRIVIFAVVLAVASAIGVMVLASRPASSDMPGMLRRKDRAASQAKAAARAARRAQK